MNPSVEIFGEYHTTEERIEIENKIKELHSIQPFDFLLSEEVGDAVAVTRRDKLELIKTKYYSIGPMSYHLGIELGIPVIGIDEWGIEDKLGVPSLPLADTFVIREKRMLAVIERYSKLGRVAVLIGDAHLRDKDSKQLGKRSVISTQFKDKKGFIIHRSRNREDK